MLKVGLTGGIAVGKSYITRVLAELGCHVFDADQIARDVVAPGTTGYQQVINEFGSEIVASDGQLDRAKLGQIVFHDEIKRQRLNEILHPIIIAEQNRRMVEVAAREPQAIVVVDAALMIESGSYKRFDKLIVAYCDRETQIKRLMQRNQLTYKEAEARVASQMPSEEKRRYADFAIDTSADFEQTRQDVINVYQQLRRLAKQQPDH
ncbi:MAG: dephospho-CoA kinase [Acidobacteriota bacterium]